MGRHSRRSVQAHAPLTPSRVHSLGRVDPSARGGVATLESLFTVGCVSCETRCMRVRRAHTPSPLPLTLPPPPPESMCVSWFDLQQQQHAGSARPIRGSALELPPPPLCAGATASEEGFTSRARHSPSAPREHINRLSDAVVGYAANTPVSGHRRCATRHLGWAPPPAHTPNPAGTSQVLQSARCQSGGTPCSGGEGRGGLVGLHTLDLEGDGQWAGEARVGSTGGADVVPYVVDVDASGARAGLAGPNPSSPPDSS